MCYGDELRAASEWIGMEEAGCARLGKEPLDLLLIRCYVQELLYRERSSYSSIETSGLSHRLRGSEMLPHFVLCTKLVCL